MNPQALDILFVVAVTLLVAAVWGSVADVWEHRRRAKAQWRMDEYETIKSLRRKP